MGRVLTEKDILSSEIELNGKYVNLTYYASGGFGITYLSTDKTLERQVIIKEFCPANYLEENIIERIYRKELKLLKREYQFDFDYMKEEFYGEAQKTAQLKHPNIVNVMEIFHTNNTSYIVYEFVEKSVTLNKFLGKNDLEINEKIEIVISILDALIYTHEKNIIHRDLNPNNILIVIKNQKIEIKLIDFGLAKNTQSGSLTIRSAFPGFAPPEQLIPKMSGVHTDIYSLGALLYLLLTKEFPPSMMRNGEEDNTKLVINSDKLSKFLYNRLIEAKIEENLIKIVLKAMRYNYEERYKNTTNFKTALEELYKSKNNNEKECPFCAEIIKKNASICRFCNRNLLEEKPIIIDNKIDTDITKRKVKEIENMVLIEAGSFNMGSTSYPDEKPIHKVTLSSFYIGKYETTQSEYQAIMGSNPSYFKGDASTSSATLPVEQVSWYDAIKYCNAKSKKEGFSVAYDENTGELLDIYGNITTDITKVKGYRLPTEAEWEYAARGGNKTNNYKYSGSNNEIEVGWFSSNSGSKTHEVGSKKSNELGLYDMSGNVWEWCTDWYDDDYYNNSNLTNPINTKKGSFRLRRGGGWSYDADDLRVADRSSSTPAGTSLDFGFRLSRTP